MLPNVVAKCDNIYQVASINRIPKPKPKVEKPVKNETEGNGGKADDTSSSSKDDNTSEKDQTGGPESSGDAKAEADSKAHDEL